MHRPDVAVVVGVGASEGLGAGVARRLSKAGLTVFVVGRTRDRLESIVAEMRAAGQVVHAAVVDATDPAQVERVFAGASSEGRIAVAVFNAGNNQPRTLLDSDPDFFEQVWRVTCFAGHLFAMQAVRHMLPAGGTVLFTGASASLRGRAGFEAFASGKAGLRAIAQSMAREFAPQGLHVAHVIIDGGIDGERVRKRFPDAKGKMPPDALLSIDAVAETYWQIHLQHRSAWTHELDLRPYCETF